MIYVGEPESPREGRKLRRLGVLLNAAHLVWQADRRGVVLSLAPQFVAAGATAWQLLLMRDLISALIVQADSAQIVAPLLGIVLAGAVATTSGVINSLQQQVLGEVVSRQLQSRLLGVMARVDIGRFETPQFQDGLRRAQVGMGRIVGVTASLLSLGRAGTVIAAVAIALFVLSPILVVIALAGFIPLWLAQSATSRATFLFWKQQTANERKRSYLVTLFTSREHAKELRAYGLGPYLQGLFLQLSDARLVELSRLVRRRARVLLGGAIASAAFNAGSLGALAFLVYSGRLGIAEAGAAAAASQQLKLQLDGLASSMSQLYDSALYLEDWEDFLATPTTPSLPAGTLGADFEQIEACAISFSYPASAPGPLGRPALENVSLRIRRGEIVALVGENGSGKTTLAKILSGLYRPDAGRILWDGIDTTPLDPAATYERVAVLFQDFAHFMLTTRENIGLGRATRLQDDQAIRAAGQRAGADGFITGWPEGYETVLGPVFFGGKEISVGQWQRIALARAFFRDAPLVILDEPTAALDPRAEHELFANLRELFVGRSVLLISHRFSTVRAADRIYVLHEGRIVEEGSHDQLMKRAGRYAELFSLQARGYVTES